MCTVCVCRNAQKSEEVPDLPEPEFQTVVSCLQVPVMEA